MFNVFTSVVRDLKSELSSIKDKIEDSVHDAISGSFEHKKRKADKFKNEAAKKNYIPLEETHIRFSAVKETVSEAKESRIGMAPEQLEKMDEILDEGLSILQDRMRFYEVAEAETWDVAKKIDEHDFILDLPEDVKSKLKRAKKEVKAETKDKSALKKKSSFGFRKFRSKKGGFQKGFQGGFQQGGFQQHAELESLHLLADLTEAAEFEGFRRAAKPSSSTSSGQPSAPKSEPWLRNRLRQHIAFWRTFCTSAFILSILTSGYQLPWSANPPVGPRLFSNYPSAFEYPEYPAVASLVASGAALQVQNRPFIVKAQVLGDFAQAGFVLSTEKCQLQLSHVVKFLGFVIDMLSGVFRLTALQKTKLQDAISSARSSPQRVPAKLLARITGLLASMKLVTGSVSGLFTRYLHRALNTRSSWRSTVSLDAAALSKLSFWTSSLDQFSARPIWRQFSLVLVLQYDAGANGWGGHVVISGQQHFAHGAWAPDEVHGCRSSTWRELQGLHRLLRSVGHLLRGHRVIARGDAQNVFWILDRGGSRLEHLQEICLDIFWLCHSLHIDLTPDWVPRAQNELADYLSKLVDYDDFGLQPAAFSHLLQQLGPFDIDCFASEHNALLPAFFSELWTPRAHAANAFAQPWSGFRCYCFPPPKLIPRVLQHALESCTDIVLVVLDWPGQFWWPLLRSGSGWAPFVRRSVRFPMGPATLRRGSATSFFGHGFPLCDVFALDIPVSGKIFRSVLILFFSSADVFGQHAWSLEDAGLPADDPVLSTLLSELRARASQSRAEGTVSTYSGHWKRFKTFCQARGVPFLPASPLTVALYFTFLLRSAKTPSPILSCSGAIFFHHSIAGLPSPTQHPMVAMARQIARRTLTKGKNQKTEPLLASHIFQLFDTWLLSPGADLVSAMKLAAISLCYAGFFRFSDLMTVQWQEIRFESSHMECFLEKSKTDQFREGRWVLISRVGGERCIVQLVERLIHFGGYASVGPGGLIRNIVSTPVGQRVCSSVPCYSTVNAWFKEAAQLLGLDPDQYATHSGRRGGATRAANVDVPDRLFKEHGGWRSERAKDGYVVTRL
ncbi:hypothetical protein KFL_003850140, partial [Klebsormidium nitens]